MRLSHQSGTSHDQRQGTVLSWPMRRTTFSAMRSNNGFFMFPLFNTLQTVRFVAGFGRFGPGSQREETSG